MESYIVVSEGLPESVSLCYNLGIVNAEVAEAQRTHRKTLETLRPLRLCDLSVTDSIFFVSTFCDIR